MANELNIMAGLSFNKGGGSITKRDNVVLTVTGDSYTSNIQSIGITEEEVVQGADLGTPGYVYLKNLDPTNYIEIGSTTGVYDIRLKAKEVALYRHNSATIYAKANTAACLLEYIIIED
jgi:hypothetical protein